MSDHSALRVARRGPLDEVPLPQGDGFTAQISQHAARFVLRGQPGDVAAFGLPAPGTMRATTDGTRAALRLGPDEFLLIAPGEEPAAVEGRLKRALPEGRSSLVDVSHRQIGLILEGRLAARCLSAGCPLDLRLEAFPVGMATRTIFMKAEIVLWRQAEDRFYIEVWRSFSPYVVAHLTEALSATTGL